jgi:predicted kinase
VQKVVADETTLRSQILADIEAQKKYADKLTEERKFSEADATFKALLQQLASIPGTEAKLKYAEMVKSQKVLQRKWAADILEKAHFLILN